MKNMCFYIGTLLIVLISIEVISFILYHFNLTGFVHRPIYAQEHPVEYWRTEYHPWGAWRRKDARAIQEKSCFSVTYQSNEVGARDQPFDNTAEQRTIIALGDSFAEGFGVEVEDRFDGYLEELPNTQVINLGVAYHVGPVQYYLIYRHFKKEYAHTDVLVMFLPANDFGDNAPAQIKKLPNRYRPYYRPLESGGYEIFYARDAPDGEPSIAEVLKRSGLFDRVRIFLKTYTWSSGLIRQIVYIYRLNTYRLKSYSSVSKYFNPKEDELEAAIFFLEKIVQEAEGRNVTIFIIPTLVDFLFETEASIDSEDSVVVRSMNAMAARNHNVAVIDGLKVMKRQTDDPVTLFLTCDPHWGPKGHEIAGSVLKKHMAISAP